MPRRRGSRGQKKPSLRDLSFEEITPEELAALHADFGKMDARALALTITAMLDRMLERAIESTFALMTEADFNEIFRGKFAPLGTMAAKILMAYALGIYGLEARKQLDRLRAIRNVFAHSVKRFDFSHPMISKECAALTPGVFLTPYQEKAATDPRAKFTNFGLAASLYLATGLAYRAAHNVPRPEAPEPLPPSSAAIFEELRLRSSQNQD